MKRLKNKENRPSFIKTISKLLILLLLTSCSMGIVEYDRQTITERYANPKDGSQFIDIDGTNVHYRLEGNPNGETILLLHGICDSLYTWEGWVKELKNEYQILRIDVPGFGLTYPVNIKSYDQDTYADFIEKLRARFNIEKFIIGGNSLGGFISWSYASKFPQRISHLIMTDPAGYPLSPPWVVKLASWPILGWIGKNITPRYIAKDVALDVYGDDSLVTEKVIDRYYDMLMTKGNRDLYFEVFKEINRFASTNLPGKNNLKMPTLLIWGEMDKWIPTSQIDQWKKDVPHIQVMRLKDAGHVPQEERPIKTANRVQEFLKSN